MLYLQKRTSFKRCVTHINDEHTDAAENLDIKTPMYNLIEYSDNYSGTSGSLWQFKKDQLNVTNAANVTTENSSSFKCKSSALEKSVPINNRVLRNVKMAVPLKCFSNFWRSLEMPLINCKIHLELNWTKNCVMSNNSYYRTLKITHTKLYVSIITLSTEDNVKLAKQ